MDHKELQITTIALSLTKGIGPVSFKKILTGIDGEISQIKYKDIAKLANLNLASAKKIFEELSSTGIGMKCLWEEDYPIQLKNIPDPPIVIYYRGLWDIEKINNSISIVGSRKSTVYGRNYVKEFVSSLSKANLSIVSGLAVGIDREAHIQALENGSYTIGVMPTSINYFYPNANRDLYNKILKNRGLIISENYNPIVFQKGLFISRNRIIAGISKATLIIEAGIKSGALSTANFALNYNREVYALPGNVNSENSKGCNNLIRNSTARLISDANDIISELGLGKINNDTSNLDSSLNLEAINKLSHEQKSVYESIRKEPLFVEEISAILKLTLSDIISICSILELKGLILRNEIGKYTCY